MKKHTIRCNCGRLVFVSPGCDNTTPEECDCGTRYWWSKDGILAYCFAPEAKNNKLEIARGYARLYYRRWKECVRKQDVILNSDGDYEEDASGILQNLPQRIATLITSSGINVK